MAEPYCLAMVLCDRVHRDATTGKFTLLGTFSALASKEYPTQATICVYFAVTDGTGKTKICVKIWDATLGLVQDDSEAIFISPIFETDFVNPLMVVEGVLEFGNAVSLPHPGLYYCELLANDTVLMTRRLVALGPPAQESETKA